MWCNKFGEVKLRDADYTVWETLLIMSNILWQISWKGLFETYIAFMMTLSNGNIFHVTGPLCGEFTGHRWIPLMKASEAECWCFLWSAPEKTVEQTIWINFGSGNDRRHQAITWTNIDLSLVGSCDIHQKAIALEVLTKVFSTTYLKIIHLKSKRHELIEFV